MYCDDHGLIVTNNEPTKDNLKTLHKTIKKVAEDIEGFSFNTSVSQFMICVNELSTQNCHSRAILEPLAILISPYAPHIAEELWQIIGNSESVHHQTWPVADLSALIADEITLVIQIMGKTRGTIQVPATTDKDTLEKYARESEVAQRYLEGKEIKKVVVVPGKLVNFVVA